MGDRRIFIIHAMDNQSQKDAHIFEQLTRALRSAGNDVITNLDEGTDEDSAQFWEQKLSTYQWVILFQTPQANASPRILQAINTATQMATLQSLLGVLRFVSSTNETEDTPSAWKHINTFDATSDYQRAIEKLLLTLSSSKNVPMVAPSAPKIVSAPALPSIGYDYDRPTVPPKKLKMFSQAAQGKQPLRSFLQRRRLLLMIITALLLIAVISVALSGFIFNHPTPTSSKQPITATPQTYGNVYFFNSELIGPDNTTGTCDEMQITLKNLKTPADGNSYYAWLLPDHNTFNNSTTSLGKLTLKNGTVKLKYTSSDQTNILLNKSRFLITEENSSISPNSPSPDQSTWRYYAAISQTPNPKNVNHYSELDYLRQLLTSNGGLNTGLYGNTREIEGYATAAQLGRAKGTINNVDSYLTYILDYLDGAQFASADVPRKHQNDMPPPAMPLLTLHPGNQNPAGYITNLEQDMQGLSSSPGIPANQRALAQQITTALIQINKDLNQVHVDATRLIAMPINQYKSQATLLLREDLLVHANNAFVGQVDPTTGQRSGGVTWIYDSLPQLATLNVAPYINIGN